MVGQCHGGDGDGAAEDDPRFLFDVNDPAPGLPELAEEVAEVAKPDIWRFAGAGVPGEGHAHSGAPDCRVSSAGRLSRLIIDRGIDRCTLQTLMGADVFRARFPYGRGRRGFAPFIGHATY